MSAAFYKPKRLVPQVVTVVDELAAQEVLAQLLSGLHRKRLLEFLNAAAASPAAAQWPTSSGPAGEVEDLLERPSEVPWAEERELFPHQVATIEWMQRIERTGRQRMEVRAFSFAGATLGSAYELYLPLGGVVAHPPGAGGVFAKGLASIKFHKHIY